MKITVEISEPEALKAALAIAIKSMGYDMYQNTSHEMVRVRALIDEVTEQVKREELYDDSRSHTRIDGMVRPEHYYCEYHDQYEESDDDPRES